MKFFNSIESSFANVGIYRHLAFNDYKINLKNSVICVILGQNVILATIKMFKGKTFGEYFECFYNTATVMSHFVTIGEFVRKTLKIYELISSFENTIKKRK